MVFFYGLSHVTNPLSSQLFACSGATYPGKNRFENGRRVIPQIFQNLPKSSFLVFTPEF